MIHPFRKKLPPRTEALNFEGDCEALGTLLPLEKIRNALRAKHFPVMSGTNNMQPVRQPKQVIKIRSELLSSRSAPPPHSPFAITQPLDPRMTDTAHVLVSKPTSHILLLTINRPEQRNAFTHQTGQQLASHLIAFDKDQTLSVCVITGAGGCFCAGADLKDAASPQPSFQFNEVDLSRMYQLVSFCF